MADIKRRGTRNQIAALLGLLAILAGLLAACGGEVGAQAQPTKELGPAHNVVLAQGVCVKFIKRSGEMDKLGIWETGKGLAQETTSWDETLQAYTTVQRWTFFKDYLRQQRRDGLTTTWTCRVAPPELASDNWELLELTSDDGG